MKSHDQIQDRIDNFNKSLAEYEKMATPSNTAIKFNRIYQYRRDELIWALDKTKEQIKARELAIQKRYEREEDLLLQETLQAMKLELIWVIL